MQVIRPEYGADNVIVEEIHGMDGAEREAECQGRPTIGMEEMHFEMGSGLTRLTRTKLSSISVRKV
jgi:hypothetical protein